jgi:hypothetical protein
MPRRVRSQVNNFSTVFRICGKHVGIATDGEVRRITTPLRFAVERAALKAVAGVC